MGLTLGKMKEQVKKSGANKSKFIYFREGDKARVRFLTDLEDGLEVTFHDSFEAGINVPCQETFGRECEYCDDDSLRTRSQFLWCVWDYEAKEVKILMAPINNCSPVPAIMAMYENYGTLVDRDYIITVTGKQADKTFQVVPLDKAKFRNTKAKELSENKILSLLDKAFPDENASDDDEDESPKKKKGKAKSKAKSKPEPKVEDDFDEEDWEDEDDAEDFDYDSMSEKELYKLCKEREIEAKPKKNKRYYVNLLEEFDEAQNDWDDDDDDEEDDWGDDDE